MLASSYTLHVGALSGGHAPAALGRPALQRGQLRPSSSLSRQQQRTVCRLQPLQAAAADGSPAEEAAPADAADELPLWRFLLDQGFSADSISRIRSKTYRGRDGKQYSRVSGRQITASRVQEDLSPNMAALRAESLDTASIQRLFEQYPLLLGTRHATFSSALAALRRLAALLPDDPRAVQAPAGSTQLGAVLWLYPTATAYLLSRSNLASLLESNLQLRRRLGVSDAAIATGLLKNSRLLVSNFERAEAMVAHLQRVRASGKLSADQVVRMALAPGALYLAPDQFDRRWLEGGFSGPGRVAADISRRDLAGRQREAAEAVGELLQLADGVAGPLQQQYRQQGEALGQRHHRLRTSWPAALRANWASLRQLGLSDSQLGALVRVQPAVLFTNWQGEAKQRLLDWVQQELGLSPYDFLLHHSAYCTHSVAKLAMRADFLRQHRHAVWHATLARGIGPVLSLLTDNRRLSQAGCTATELAAFNRAWLATPAGRRWGGKALRRRAATESQ